MPRIDVNTSVSAPLAPRSEEIPSPDRCVQDVFHNGVHSATGTAPRGCGVSPTCRRGDVSSFFFFSTGFSCFLYLYLLSLWIKVCVCECESWPLAATRSAHVGWVCRGECVMRGFGKNLVGRWGFPVRLVINSLSHVPRNSL